MRGVGLAWVAMLLLSLKASAGLNTFQTIFLDADDDVGNEVVNRVDPGMNELFDVYVCFANFGPSGETSNTGILEAAFKFERTFAGFKLVQENLLQGPDFGDVEVDGWWITAGTECQMPEEGCVLVAAHVTYLYLGAPGTIKLLPHPTHQGSTTDCNNEQDYWCVRSILRHGHSGHFGVCVDPPDGDCEGWWQTGVVCEPQGGGDPNHPPTYWYDITPGYTYPTPPFHGFHVQVFDPDIRNYTNWVEPDGWVHSDSVLQVGDEFWVSWCDPELDDGLTWFYSPYRFQFDNPNPPTWGEWALMDDTSPCDPLAEFADASLWHNCLSDGYGYRVHAPVAAVSVDDASWGRIKALYR